MVLNHIVLAYQLIRKPVTSLFFSLPCNQIVDAPN
jgi:hypothetical protein